VTPSGSRWRGRRLLSPPVRDRRSRIPRPLPDRVGPGLRLLFVGINPGLVSASAGHYYANPRNTFWRLLHEAGLTSVRLRPAEEGRLLSFGFGLTDIVKRPSRGAADLTPADYATGRQRLIRLVKRLKPRATCFNGKTAFEGYFGTGMFRGFGPQRVRLGGIPVFVLPSTSPANATLSLSVKRRYFRALKTWLGRSGTAENRAGTGRGTNTLANPQRRPYDVRRR
jgi:double-stranded uracil-DNA glycosylase